MNASINNPMNTLVFFPATREETYGKGLQGYVTACKADMISIFGEPNIPASEDGKIMMEWAIKFADGTIATIYDWKNEGTLEMAYNKEFEWNVGGNAKAVAYVQQVLDDSITPERMNEDEDMSLVFGTPEYRARLERNAAIRTQMVLDAQAN